MTILRHTLHPLISSLEVRLPTAYVRLYRKDVQLCIPRVEPGRPTRVRDIVHVIPRKERKLIDFPSRWQTVLRIPIYTAKHSLGRTCALRLAFPTARARLADAIRSSLLQPHTAKAAQVPYSVEDSEGKCRLLADDGRKN